MHAVMGTGRLIAGRYRLHDPIGRGAMGIVWRGRDELLDRDVAVKEVQINTQAAPADAELIYQRTLREARTAARLSHPSVVTVFDVVAENGSPWIVMELIQARSLDRVITEDGPLPPEQAAHLGASLVGALATAHSAGVLHRDVKPSNVLVTKDGRAVLTDFGIATFAEDLGLTQAGMVVGTPGFTAPERIRGEDASAASDLWSLGATLFAAVEGHGPFEKRGGAITTMSAIINEDAPDAPDAGALGPVIAALLRREPADRPDASAAARMITDVLPLLPDRTPASPTGYEATVLSASPRPAPPGWAQPGPVPPRLPEPGEVPLDFASAEQTIAKESPAAGTDPLASAAQTAPTTPQPVQGDPSRYPPPGSSWGQGAGAGYSSGAAGSAARPEGPPPDFSSWYDPAPRTGATAEPGSGSAWSGSASSASQPGSGAAYQPQPAPWSGSAPGPAPWSGAGYEPPRRQRSGAGWKIAIAVLAIIGAGAGAATVVLLHQNHSDSSQGGGTTATGSASGSSAATLPSAKNAPQIVDAINEPATGPLPNGFTTISQPAAANETAGFRLAAPTSWKVSTSGDQTYLKDPAEPNTNILIDLTPHTYPNDMLREAKYVEARSIPDFPGYQRVGLAALNIRGTPGSYWKFTWTDEGTEQEAIDLLFVMHTSAGPQSYALYMTAPEKSFAQIRPIFDEEVGTFATLPS